MTPGAQLAALLKVNTRRTVFITAGLPPEPSGKNLPRRWFMTPEMYDERFETCKTDFDWRWTEHKCPVNGRRILRPWRSRDNEPSR